MQQTAHPASHRHNLPSRLLLQASLWVGWIAIGMNAWLISQW
jgi:hypothetical protein